MPKCALPDHIDEPHEWDGKDDDQHWFTKWRKNVKHLMAFGPRCLNGVCFGLFPPWIFFRKWSMCPKVLIAFKGGGKWRWENTNTTKSPTADAWLPGGYREKGWYLSRQQLWTRWHIQLQWPLFFAFHWYKNKKDVLIEGTEDRDGKVVFFYIGAKFDADLVYWWPALFLGFNWK